jgi:hypothetical protein
LNPLFRVDGPGRLQDWPEDPCDVAEAQEQVHDIVAEVHAESDQQTTASKSTPAGLSRNP